MAFTALAFAYGSTLTSAKMTQMQDNFGYGAGAVAPAFSAGFSGTTGSLSGNLAFTGTANRITGDFGNATSSNRPMFQSSVANESTAVSAIPNGASAVSGFRAFNNSNPDNASYFNMVINATEAIFSSHTTGTGTYLPIKFYLSGADELTIDTSGNFYPSTTNANTLGGSSNRWSNTYSVLGNYSGQITSSVATGTAPFVVASTTEVANLTAATATNQSGGTVAATGITASGAITSSSPTAGIGYVAGAGGSVTQITSITTGVTLNKVCGEITTVSIALAADERRSFILTNSTIETDDMVLVMNQGGTFIDCYANLVSAGQCYITIANTYSAALANSVHTIRFEVRRSAQT